MSQWQNIEIITDDYNENVFSDDYENLLLEEKAEIDRQLENGTATIYENMREYRAVQRFSRLPH